MRDLDVLSFGEALVDFFPERPGVALAECDVFHRQLGGAPANVAVGLARLGARVGLMTLVGPDAFGTYVRDRLLAEGVDIAGVGVHRTAKTGVTFVCVGAHGERSFLFFRHPSADQMIAEHDVDESVLARARVVHVGSSTLAREPSRSATLKALAAAKRAGCLVSTDPNWRAHLWENPAEAAPMLQALVAQCDIVKISDDELAPLTGVTDPEEGAHKLRALGPPLVVVTLGARGCYVEHRKRPRLAARRARRRRRHHRGRRRLRRGPARHAGARLCTGQAPGRPDVRGSPRRVRKWEQDWRGGRYEIGSDQRATCARTHYIANYLTMSTQTQVKVADPKARDVLLDALKQKSRGQTALVKLTRADAVALTGLPNDQAEPALKSLVETYRSHMAVTDEGELVYEFDPSLERRDKVSLREKLAAAGQLAWKGFQVLFKIWIVVTLVAYVVAFIAMMVSLMVASSSSIATIGGAATAADFRGCGSG